MSSVCKKNSFNLILVCSITSINQIKGNPCTSEGFIPIRMLLVSMKALLILKTKAKLLPSFKKNLKINHHIQIIQIKTQ